jgi:hypothetical protein
LADAQGQAFHSLILCGKRSNHFRKGDAFIMRFPKQFVGGVLVGLAFGILIRAALVEGKKEVNYTSIAGVGSMLAIAGVLIARGRSPKS